MLSINNSENVKFMGGTTLKRRSAALKALLTFAHVFLSGATLSLYFYMQHSPARYTLEFSLAGLSSSAFAFYLIIGLVVPCLPLYYSLIAKKEKPTLGLATLFFGALLIFPLPIITASALIWIPAFNIWGLSFTIIYSFIKSSLIFYLPASITPVVVDMPAIIKITKAFTVEDADYLAQMYISQKSSPIGSAYVTLQQSLNSLKNLNATETVFNTIMPSQIKTAFMLHLFNEKYLLMIECWKCSFAHNLVAGNIYEANVLLQDGPQQARSLVQWGLSKSHFNDTRNDFLLESILASDFKSTQHWKALLLEHQQAQQKQTLYSYAVYRTGDLLLSFIVTTLASKALHGVWAWLFGPRSPPAAKTAEGTVLFDSQSFFLKDYYIKLFKMFLKAFCDTPEAWQLGFQDPASPIIEGIINLHHDIMFFLVSIFVFVCTMFFVLITHFDAEQQASKFYYPALTHHTLLEFVWTLVPVTILLLVAIPSFALIYSVDDLLSAEFTLKVYGHQWYWSYEYGDIMENGVSVDDASAADHNFRSLRFDSYMVAEEDLPLGAFRLLEVDQRVYLPIRTHIRILVTSADVLHSWAVPSLGVKIDACPGRISQLSTYITRPGIFYGQCSEICGVNHAFMPVVVEAF